MTTVILTAEHDGTTDVNLAHETEAGTGFDSGTGHQIADANTSTSTEYRAGLRFTGTSSIPALANTIYNAALEVSVTSSGGKSPTNYDDPYVFVYAEEDTDAPDYSTDADVFSRSPLTSSYAFWSEANIGTGYNTMPVSIQDDLAAAIQEVIDDTAWASGNAINLLTVPVGTSLRHFRWLRSTSLPKLHISFHPDVDADDKVYVYSAGDSFNLAQGSGYRNIPAAGRPAGAGGQLVMVWWGEKDASTSYLFSPQSGAGWTSVVGHLFASNTGYGGAAVAEDDGTDYWTNAFYNVVTVGGQTCKVFRVHNADLSDLGLIQDFDTENETTGTNILYTANANHTSPKHSLQFALAGHANTSSGMTPPPGYTERMDEAPSPGSDYGRVAAYTRETTTFTTPMNPAPTTHASGAAAGAAQGITFVIPSGTSTGTLLGRGVGAIIGRATTTPAAAPITAAGVGAGAAAGRAVAAATKPGVAAGAGAGVGRAVLAVAKSIRGRLAGVVVGRATTTTAIPVNAAGVQPAADVGRTVTASTRSALARLAGSVVGRGVTFRTYQETARASTAAVGVSAAVKAAGTAGQLPAALVGRATTSKASPTAGAAAGAVLGENSGTVAGLIAFTVGRAPAATIGRAVTVATHTTTSYATLAAKLAATSSTARPTAGGQLPAVVVGRAATSTVKSAFVGRNVGASIGRAVTTTGKATLGRMAGAAYAVGATLEGYELGGRGTAAVVGRATTSIVRTTRARLPAAATPVTGTTVRSATILGRGATVTVARTLVISERVSAGAVMKTAVVGFAPTTQAGLGAPDATPVRVEYSEAATATLVDPAASAVWTEYGSVEFIEG